MTEAPFRPMRINRPRSDRGSTLLTTLLMSVVVGITLASYLTLVSAQNRAVMHSLAWNATMPVLEAGIEEALTQLRECGLTNLSRNGWEILQPGPGGRYLKRRALGRSHFEVTILATDPPLIESTGFEPLPISANGLHVRRRVRCETRRDSYFDYAMLARISIDLHGARVATDSFDSSDPLYSTGGHYDPKKVRDGGDIAALGDLDIGNAKISGTVSTAPEGEITVGPGGAVGSSTWMASGEKGIEPGWSAGDLTAEIPPVTLPALPWQTTYAGNIRIGSTNFNYVLGSAAYKILAFKGSVYVAGNASVYVPVDGTFDFSGKDLIYVAPGASLNVYAGPPTASLSGNGLLNPGTAVNFTYWGLDTNTKLSISGNAGFIGSIYAPNAELHLSGSGGSQLTDFTGASVTKTVTVNGGFNFHYDEALRKLGPSRGFVLDSWNEVPAP